MNLFFKLSRKKKNNPHIHQDNQHKTVTVPSAEENCGWPNAR